MSERLLLTPEPAETMRPGKASRFVATLESSGEHVVKSHQPLLDGARELLARGWPPDELLTMRHAAKAHDSFAPRTIGTWAKWTHGEGEKMPLQRQWWKPRGSAAAHMRDGQKSGSAEGKQSKGPKRPAALFGAAAISSAAADFDD